MAESALSKLKKIFVTPQHDYKISTELFGQFDANKVAKELDLEKKGVAKGAENKPAASSQIPDDVESQISERLESAKTKANEIAENQIQTYSDRISNLDFEGHFSELRQLGPIVINEIQNKTQTGLNEMNTKRKKLLDIEKEYEHFRKKNRLEYRTAKMSSSTHNFLRILVLIIMVSVETFLNGSFLAKNNAAGILGGSFDAFSFAFINIGFSVIITIFVIKQIVRPAFIWKIIGLLGIATWIAIVLIINLALAHFRETSGTFLNGAANDVVQRLWERPLELEELKSWVLFAVGSLFAAITLADVITFSDIFPGYTKLQEKWDDEQEEYKEEFEQSLEDVTDIKEEYQDTLKKIGDDLTIRQQELDKIITGKNRLIAVYESHHEHLQRSADVLFSAYFEANKSKRTKPAPKRYDLQYKISKTKLSSGENFSSSETKKIKKKIADAKKLLDDQISEVLETVSSSIEQYNTIDKLDESRKNG
jgi:hypothetical protein